MSTVEMIEGVLLDELSVMPGSPIDKFEEFYQMGEGPYPQAVVGFHRQYLLYMHQWHLCRFCFAGHVFLRSLHLKS